MTVLACVLGVLVLAAPAGARAGADQAALVGPPAPDFAYPGSLGEQLRSAAAARDDRGREAFANALEIAPEERNGRCEDAARFDGVGTGCRTQDGLLRLETSDGGSITTHGPDYVESATDANPTELPPRMVAAIRQASKADIACVSPSERHVRLVYAVPADGEDRSATVVPALRQSAYEMSAVIDNEARMLTPGSGRRLRMLCDGNGDAVVEVRRLRSTQSALAAGGFGSVITDLHAASGTIEGAGSLRYLVFYDADLGSYSGIGQLYGDDSAAVSNYNNSGGMVALQDNTSGSASPSWFVLLHESTHNMGGVQDSMPDASGFGHCTDGMDVECYEDGSGQYTSTACPLLQYDCDHDTYFNTAPAAGSPLATKWNVASSANGFLEPWGAPADTTAPSMPANLQSTGGGSFVRLTWDASTDAGSGVSAYRVYRQNGASWSIVDDAWPGDTTLDATWSGITSNTSFSFRVTAYDRRGNESAPATITASTGAAGLTRVVGGTLPTPVNVRATDSTTTSVTLAWDPIIASGTTRYRIRRRLSPAGSWSSAGTTTSTTMSITGLATGTTYDFQVSAYDATGRESGGTVVTATSAGGSDVTAPPAPSNVRIASSAGTAPTLAWDATASATSYRIEVESSPGAWTVAGTTADLDFVVRSLQYGTSTQLGVVALDSALNASPRATVTFNAPAAPDRTPPSVPSINSTNRTMTSITVGWTAATDNVGVASYRLYAARADTGQFNFAASTTSLSATATGLTPNTTYWLRVYAVDANGYASDSTSYAIVTTSADTTPPSNVTGLAASGQTSSSVNLAWNAATDNSGVAAYRVFRRESDLSWTLLGTTTATSYMPSGLAASTSYTFGVRAVDVAGLESASTTSVMTSTSSATPDVTAPSQPASATVGAVTGTTVPLSWTASTDDVAVTSYRIYRTAPNASGSPIATIAAPATSTTITGLSSETAYTFAITARDAAGNESTAATVTATTLDVTPPTQPGGVTTTSRTTTTITLGWNASSDSAGGVVQYRIYRQMGGTWVAQATTGATSWQATGLAQSSSYTFAVASIDAAANESAKTTHATNTLDLTPPSTPGTITPSAIGGTSMTLSWGASTDDLAVAGYRVYRQSPSASGTPIASPASTSTSLSGLSSGVSYTFAVTAVDAAGNESPTRTVTVTTADVVAPTQPGSFAGTALGETSIRLTWAAASDNVAVTGYRVLRVVSGVSSPIATTGSLQYDVTGLAPATSYRFRIEAYDAAGNVSTRATVDVSTPDTTAPAQPASGSVTSRSDTAIALAWSGSSDNVAVTGYRIYRAAPTASGVPVGTTTAGTTTWRASGLSASTAYTFEVAAIDAAGNESARLAISGTTSSLPDTIAPTTPTDLTASGVAPTSARLSWTASIDAGGVARYRIDRLTGGWSIVNFTSGTEYDLAGLAPGTAYTFQVLAFDAANNASDVATVQFTTPLVADVTPPSAPAGPLQLSATATGSVGLAWAPASDDVGVASYRVYRSDGGSWTQVGATTGTSLMLTDQPVGVTASYAVAAVDGAGNVGAMLAGQVRMPSPLRGAPGAPAWVTATATATSITLSWAGDAAASSWSVDALRNGAVVDSRTVAGTTTTFSGYLPGTSLTFAVRANGDGGTSAAASIATATLRDTVKPITPRLTRGVALTGSRALFAWTASSDTYGIARYEVRLVAARTRMIVLRTSPSTRGALASRLVRGRTYFVNVRAVDRYGNSSAWSNALRIRAR